jgi:hypothetical protein
MRIVSRILSRWYVVVAAAFVGLALLVAACGGGSTSATVAGAGSATSTSVASANGSPSNEAAQALAYSQCMRDHGITDFPDPDANGGLTISASPGSNLDPNSPQYQAADEACKSLMPRREISPEQQAEMREQNLKYAQCMRSQGISDFPDPKSDGSLQIQTTPGGDLDPENPKFQVADKACEQYRPKGDGGLQKSIQGSEEGTPGGSGQ